MFIDAAGDSPVNYSVRRGIRWGSRCTTPVHAERFGKVCKQEYPMVYTESDSQRSHVW
jgi:hypothetical protein